MVEPRRIELLSEISTCEMSSYAIDSVPAMPCGELLAILSSLHSGRTGLVHLHHLICSSSNKESCSGTVSLLTSNATTVQVHHRLVALIKRQFPRLRKQPVRDESLQQ